MRNKAIWIAATAVGCAIICGVSYLLFRPSDSSGSGKDNGETWSNAGAAEGAGATGLPGGPVVPLNPALPHANTILAMPKVEDAAAAAALAPTLLNFDCEGETVEAALAAFAEASKLNIRLPTGRGMNTEPLALSLHLRNQPLMEGVLELEAQGLNIQMPAANTAAGQAITAQYQMIRRTLPGVWSITGPFTFILTGINHMVALDSQGKPGAGFVGRGAPTLENGDTLTMQITMRTEPKVHVLRYPMELDITEAVDEKGHSLVTAPATGPLRTARSPSNVNFPLRANLTYPATDAGRKIKTFRGTATYTIQLNTVQRSM
jgi:hypothetical protein